MTFDAVTQKIDRSAIIDLTTRLVRIPSVNPPGDYAEIASLVYEEMRSAELRTVVLEGEAGKPNVFGLLPASRPGAKTLLLSGHMDVVGLGELGAWRFDPFSATIAEGALWGRGTVDMKGALAAAICAAKAVKDTLGTLPVNVMLGATVDDETAGDLGHKYVLEEGLGKAGWPMPDLHVLGEANNLNVTCSFKGRLWAKVAIKGKAAHGGAPGEGVNAIEKVIEYIRRLQERPVFCHPLLGKDTLNVGTLKGGARVNAVADECEATLDFRFSAVSADEAASGFKAVMQELQAEDPSFVLKELLFFEKRDPVSVPEGSPDLQILCKAIARATQRHPSLLGALSAGDAYHSIRKGIPGVWVGPGDVRQLHAANERITLEDLYMAAEAYVAIILAYASRETRREFIGVH